MRDAYQRSRMGASLARGRLGLSLAIALLWTGCGEPQSTDPRYSSAGATVRTLFEAYRVEDLSQQEVQERMQVRGRFHLSDPDSFQDCFLDYGGPQDESLAGYVFGRLAAAKDELRFITPSAPPGQVEVHTSAEAEDEDPVILRESDGQWKISLRDSVPTQVRRQLHGIFMRAKQRALREGHPD